MNRPESLLNWLLDMKRNVLRRRLAIIHDMIMCAIAFAIAHVIGTGSDGVTFVSGFSEKLLLFTVTSAIISYMFELNSGSWRYASIPDLLAIAKTTTVSVGAYVLLVFLYSRAENIPRVSLILLWFVMITLLAGPRILYRAFREGGMRQTMTGASKADGADSAIVVYKVNDVTEAYIRSVRTRSIAPVFIAGVIDETMRRGSRTVQGLKVLGELADLAEIVERAERKLGYRITGIAVADHSLSRERLGSLVEKAANSGIKVSLIQDIVGISGVNSAKVPESKPLEIGDLIGRDEISIDMGNVTKFIEGKTVLVTGAGGSIGSELSRQIAGYNPQRLILTDISEHALYQIETELKDGRPDFELICRIADIRDEKRIDALFAKFQPQAVFHAAAIKHVPMAEQNIGEAIKTNIIGTRICADAAIRHGTAVFVLISTDKAVNPSNVMGATKRAAECYCQAFDTISTKTRFKTVRFGNVLDSRGSVVPRFRRQIERGGPVTVTHPNIVRYFMSIPEAVRLVLDASAIGLLAPEERGKILVLNMGEPVRIVDLAERMIRLAGLRPHSDIKIEYTGLRPGEKLFEELFESSEIPAINSHENYFIASPRVVDYDTVKNQVDAVAHAIAKEDIPSAIGLLRTMIPEFRSPAENDEMPVQAFSGATISKLPVGMRRRPQPKAHDSK